MKYALWTELMCPAALIEHHNDLLKHDLGGSQHQRILYVHLGGNGQTTQVCLLYTSPSPRDS